MSRILLQTTITEHPDDWDISRFSLAASELRAAGHEVIARNRASRADDMVLSHLDQLNFDQLWLMAVDVGEGLTAADAYAIRRFRENGGGVLTARDHQDLGCCISRLGSLGVVNEFHVGSAAAFERFASSIVSVLGVTMKTKGYVVAWDRIDFSDPKKPRLLCDVSELQPLE